VETDKFYNFKKTLDIKGINMMSILLK